MTVGQRVSVWVLGFAILVGLICTGGVFASNDAQPFFYITAFIVGFIGYASTLFLAVGGFFDD
jgi:hypothetical protein